MSDCVDCAVLREQAEKAERKMDILREAYAKDTAIITAATARAERAERRADKIRCAYRSAIKALNEARIWVDESDPRGVKLLKRIDALPPTRETPTPGEQK